MRVNGRIVRATSLQRKTPLPRSTKPIKRSPIKRSTTPIKRKAPTMGEAKRTSKRVRTPQKRADAAFSLFIRLSRPDCEDDRKDHVCKGRYECAHGHERMNTQTRYEERNVWKLCQGAHFFYGLHPSLWTMFMRRKQGLDLYEELLSISVMPPTDPRFRKLDYTAIAIEYERRVADLKAAGYTL